MSPIARQFIIKPLPPKDRSGSVSPFVGRTPKFTPILMKAFINMGVNLGVLPTKGLTLPLLSFGGSGLMMNCLAIGLIFRIDYENRALMKGINL